MKRKLYYISIILIIAVQTANAQCYPDRHSTSWFDGWISCEASANPNPIYGDSHWILYDLGYNYVLKETKFWNANELSHLDYGIQDFNIDYSLDGNAWINLGAFSLNQATGKTNYEGEEGPDFENIKARYVLITPISNFGGSCFGFGELKINIIDPFEVIDDAAGFNAMVYPNPFVNNVDLRIVSLFEDYPVTYTLYDILGRKITRNTLSLMPDIDTYEVKLEGSALSIGIYLLKVEQNGKQRTFKLIKNN